MHQHWLPSFVSMLVLVSACDSTEAAPTDTAPAPSSSAEPAPEPDTECRAGFVCDIQGVPFVQAALPSTDSWGPGQPEPPPGKTQATVTQPEPGKVCLSGRLELGWAWLTLAFADWQAATGWRGTLDATGLGIERIEFKLESPPQVGVEVQLVSAVPDCTQSPVDCQHWGFMLTTGTPPIVAIKETGVVSAPLSAFVRTSSTDPSWQFDASAFTTLQIGPGAGTATGDFDFCVSQLRFLDANGAEVLPLH